MNKKNTKNFLEDLLLTIDNRARNKSKLSYTKKLLQKGKNSIAQKYGEESTELLIDYLNGTKKRTIEEAADTIYHLLVLLYSKNISLKEIEKELLKRKKNVR